MSTPEEFFKHYSNLYHFEEGPPQRLIDKEDFLKAMTEFCGAANIKAAKLEWVNKPTPQMHAAIAHVKQHHPTLSLVIVNRDGRWQYMDEDFNSFVFGKEIEVFILEEASDSLTHLPFIYELPA